MVVIHVNIKRGEYIQETEKNIQVSLTHRVNKCAESMKDTFNGKSICLFVKNLFKQITFFHHRIPLSLGDESLSVFS